MMLDEKTQQGRLTLEDRAEACALALHFNARNGGPLFGAQTLSFANIERLHAALGEWLERRRPAHQLPNVRR